MRTEISHPSEVQAQQSKGNQHRSEHLRARNTHFRPRVHVNAIALPSDCRTYDVHDRHDLPALALNLHHRRQSVGGFARLTHGDVKHVGLNDWIAITELAGRLGISRDTSHVFDHLGASESSVVCSSAAQELHSTDPHEFARRHVHATEFRSIEALVEATFQGTIDCDRLLVDLLAQEVIVTTFIKLLDVPGNVENALLCRSRVECKRAITVGSKYSHLAVVERNDLFGVTHHRADIGSDKHFLVTDADDHR